jgi:hypothetical protein
MDKESQGFIACIAGTMLTLYRDKEVIAGFDRLPAAIDIGLTMTLNHEDRISLFFVGMDGGLGPGRNLKHTDSAYIGVLIGYQHCNFNIIEFRVLGENEFTLGKKFRFHNLLLIQEFCRKQSAEKNGIGLRKPIRSKGGFYKWVIVIFE